jgi:flagellar M-ring protein FliF
VGLTPKLVKASIGVQTSYFKQLWQKQNPPQEGQEPQQPDQAALDKIAQDEMDKIKGHVASLLPPVDPAAPTDLVTVTAFEDIPSPPIPSPGMGENALAWLGQYWSTLGLFGLALGSLVMLRSMIRSNPVGPAGSFAAAAKIKPKPGEGEPEPEPDVPRLQRFKGSGQSVRDELAELVQEDPDAAANILRNWIATPT